MLIWEPPTSRDSTHVAGALWHLMIADWAPSWLQEILEIEQIMDENQGMELNEDNIETVLDEIRPYLVGR